MGRIVITGSSGLVGSAVVAYALATSPHNLVLVDAKPPAQPYEDARVKFIPCDLTDSNAWADVVKGADALIHLAAFAQPYHAPPTVTHNTNVTLSWNALQAAVDAGIKRVVMIGSINAIGGAYNKETPQYRYFPLDENHPSLAEDAYSVSKQIAEVQADSVARAHPDMSIATLRFHFVVHRKPSLGHRPKPTRKDVWGWTSTTAAARACLLGLEMKNKGHEVFFIVASKHCAEGNDATALANTYYPNTELRKEFGYDEGFYSCAKAERLLGWKHDDGAQPIGDW